METTFQKEIVDTLLLNFYQTTQMQIYLISKRQIFLLLEFCFMNLLKGKELLKMVRNGIIFEITESDFTLRKLIHNLLSLSY